MATSTTLFFFYVQFGVDQGIDALLKTGKEPVELS
jgi:hypothetical protein